MPTELIVEDRDPAATDSWVQREVVSYEEAFKRELIEFATASPRAASR